MSTTTPSPELPPFPEPVSVPGWTERFPALVHGTTTRGDSGFDLRLFGPGRSDEVLARWETLRRATGMRSVVHARQVHGCAVRAHRASGRGLLLVPDCDGHLTAAPGVLLTVALADCVPLFLVAPDVRGVALLHAGWRGTAAGICESGIRALHTRFGATPDGIHAHLGPSIGRDSYEVGPEVFGALGRPVPSGPAPLDLREVQAERLLAAGVQRACISRSPLDTRTDSRFFSHRGGDGGRQVAFLGLRPEGGS